MVASESQGQLSPHMLAEVIKLLRTDPELEMDTEIENTGKIVFANGVFDVEKQLLEERRNVKDYYWAIVNANYIPGCRIEDAPVFYEYLKSSLEFDNDSDKAELLLQILGYCLSDYINAKKAFFLIGPPSCGKSIFLEFVRCLVDEEDTTQITFSKLGDRFSKGVLRESRINICGEMSEVGFPDIDSFKALTGGDVMFGERKGKDGFSYKPHVKLLNAGNVMPIPKKNDGTEAIMERMIFLIFNRSLPRSCWDTELVGKLLNEKDVICSLAVDKLKELEKSNFRFCIPKDSTTYIKTYSESQNPLKVFLEEECEINARKKELSTDMWERFTEFCKNNSFNRNVTLQVFSQTIAALPGVVKVRERVVEGQKTFFVGIGAKKINLEEDNRKASNYRNNPFVKISNPRLGNVAQKNISKNHHAQEKSYE